MGAGLLPDKEQPFLFSHWRMNTGSLLKIESSNFWGMTQWCTSSAGDEVAVFSLWHMNTSQNVRKQTSNF
jgi:hypothetical protein